MWQNLLGFLTSVWQVHLAVAGLVYHNHPIEQTLLVTLVGSSTGFSLVYLSFNVLDWFWQGLKWLTKRLKKLVLNSRKEKAVAIITRGNQQPTIRKKAIRWMIQHKSPRIIIFCLVVVPVPGTEYPAIIASRFVKMPGGYWILLVANAIRTILVVILGYYLGGKI